MAYRVFCEACGEVTPHATSVGCVKCSEIKAECAKVGHMIGLRAKTTEERIARLESAIYDLTHGAQV